MTARRGFTLLEVLLVVGIISLIAGFSIPVYQSFQVRNDLDIASNSVGQSLRRAQGLAQAGEGDSQWGVSVQSGSITVFRGTSFAARNTAFDELFTVPTTITPSGVTEVVYSKLTGLPVPTGTVTLTSTNGDVRSITINAKGTVGY